MILYIAEKPSVGRAVAQVMAKPLQKGDGFIKTADGNVVTWCIGHLLEQAEPDVYDPRFKKWRREHLPIVPETWQHTVKPATQRQFNIIKKLVHEADSLVNMGDPDRVGQILVDEIIHYCGVPIAKRESTKRCLINDMNSEAIKRALNSLRNNQEFIPLATSALARARADWLYGINMTRLCTLLGQASGYQGVLSVGRVQTPVLGIVVNQDLEIENFVAKPFYEVGIRLQTKDGTIYSAKWKPSAACEPYMDEDGRLILKKLAETVLTKVVGLPGKVRAVKEERRHLAPPLIYNLSTLQIDAAKRFNLNAQKTLDICQQLYEKYKLITYPRSDCRYLPSEHFNERKKVVRAIAHNCTDLNVFIGTVDLSLKSKVWNDAKIGAHHGIIPTYRALNGTRLTTDEQHIYELVSRQYLMQFYSAFHYQEKQIDTEVCGGIFISKQKEIIDNGWKTLLFDRKIRETESEFSTLRLPNVLQGEEVMCIDGKVDERKTTAPRHFTDATLLSAMTGIARYVKDREIKKVLRETDGLGTEATRAGIIELLFKRNYLIRRGKEIHATEVGRQLILSLPVAMTRPDMTAHWEAQLEAIAEKKLAYGQFMQPLVAGLDYFIQQLDEICFARLKLGRNISCKKLESKAIPLDKQTNTRVYKASSTE